MQVGDTVGIFKIIAKSKTDRNYTVLCNCGKTWTTRSTRIKQAKSCPKCKKPRSFSHRKVGDIINGNILLERLPSRKWKAQCSCGAVRICSPCDLTRYSQCKSCYDPNRVAQQLTLPNNKAFYNERISVYKRGAKIRNIDWLLTDDQAINLFTNECHYCGLLLTNNGIDRVDNTKGYLETNVVSCCSFCNHAKKNLTVKDFLNAIIRIYKFQFNDYPEREYTQVSGNIEPQMGEDIV